MSAELFLEIGTEEIPAGFLPPGDARPRAAAAQGTGAARIAFGEIRTFATPRRLAVAVQGVAANQERMELTVAGPSVKVAFDADGKPTRAAEGFARGQRRRGGGPLPDDHRQGGISLPLQGEEGRPTADLLPEMLPRVIAAMPFKKSMRWKDLDIRFARPIHWIVALFDGAVVPFGFGNLQSRQPLPRPPLHGPRGLPGAKDSSSWLEETRRHFVMADPAERRELIAREIERVAHAAGGEAQPRRGAARRGRLPGRGRHPAVRLLRRKISGAAAGAADHLDARAPALLHPARRGRQAAAALHHHLQHPPRGPTGGGQGERAGAARPPLRCHVLLAGGPQGQAGEPPRGAQERGLPAKARHQLREGDALFRPGRRPRRPARSGGEGSDRARRASGQVRSGDRHGLRVPRTAGGDGARVRPARRGERAGRHGDPRALPADPGRRRTPFRQRRRLRLPGRQDRHHLRLLRRRPDPHRHRRPLCPAPQRHRHPQYHPRPRLPPLAAASW